MTADILNPHELEALRLSLKVALTSVVVALPLALVAAWLLVRRDLPLKSLFDALIHLPLVVPPVVVGYLLLVGFGRQGPIGAFLESQFGFSVAFSWRGAAIAAGVMAFPLMVRAIRLSLEAVDYRLEQAARTLGSSPFKVWISVTLPLIAPGLLAAAILGFSRALGEFGATITFVSNIPGETRTLPLALYSLAQTPGGEEGAFRLTLIAVGLALLALIASEFFARRLKTQQRGLHD